MLRVHPRHERHGLVLFDRGGWPWPVWHVHPYDKIFIIREGRALFTVGEIRIEAEAGQIVFGPANIPHKFHNSVLGGWILPTFT